MFSACKKTETQEVPVVTITSINKTQLNIGDTLIIKGTNFNTDPSKNLVSVASVSYPVIKASLTQLTVIVPKNAQNGQLSVGFSSGQSTTFTQGITIIGATTPVIKSITPAAGAYESDTVVIRGTNFAIPYNSNSITFNGVAGTIINVTDSIMRVIVPTLSFTGPIQITTNGVNSPVFQYKILHVDPNADGHIYWMTPTTQYAYPYGYVNFEDLFLKGATNTALPQSVVIADITANGGGFFPTDPNETFYTTYAATGSEYDNTIINDAKNQYGYYLTADTSEFPATVTMMRLPLTGTASKPVAVWSQSFKTPVYTKFIANPTDTVDFPPAYLDYYPDQEFTIDGNTAYIKMGYSDDYYEGDLSAASPTFTLKKKVFGDPAAYEPKFGTNYIFFQEIGLQNQYYNYPGFITKIRYEARGSKNMMDVPLVLQPNEVVVNTLADPSHGDNLLIITSLQDPNTNYLYNTIYKFNADTKTFTTLYSSHNWRDGVGSGPYSGPGNNGFVWLGPHIYYSNTRYSPQNMYSTLYRLNDNGITPKIYTVYGRMEPLSLTSAAQKWEFFLGQ